MTDAQIIVLATPVFLALIALEFTVGRLRGRDTYRLPDALASIGLGIMSQLVGVFSKLLVGAQLLAHGLGPAALQAYEDEVRPQTTKVTLTNRGSGPDAIMQVVEDRCGGAFERIEDVITREELAAHAERYKAIAGFGIDALNGRADIIPREVRRN